MNRTFIVVPCYNEEERLDTEAFARCIEGQPNTSFVFVNDGSTDATLRVLQGLAARFPDRVHVVDQNPNAGKAEAVRQGMLTAMSFGADLAGYWDADLATPLEAIPRFVEVFDSHPETEIVLGARVALLGHDIDRKPSRHYLGRVFATGASLVLNVPVYDTQCGAKLMRCNDQTRELFEEPFGSRWIFDVEMLARHLKGRTNPHQIRELPLDQWTDVAGSKVKPLDFFRALGELIQVHRGYRLNESYSPFVSAATAAPVHYAGAGAIGTLAHYMTLALLVELMSASPVLGTVVGAAVGALINYFLNYHFTFTSYASHRRTLPRFLVVAGLGMAINAGGMWVGTKWLGINYLITQIGCTALVLAIGFILNKMWTFGTAEAVSGDTQPR
jgi:putative flippase GtrA